MPAEPDLLSIDIDGNDLYVWDAVTGYRPRVVVIEYNSGIRESGPVAQRPDPSSRYTGTGAFGASLDALDVWPGARGYRLAHTDLTGTNAFYVREDLWEALGVARAPRRRQNFGLTGLGNEPAQPEGGWATIELAPRGRPRRSRCRGCDGRGSRTSRPRPGRGPRATPARAGRRSRKPWASRTATQSPRVRWCST